MENTYTIYIDDEGWVCSFGNKYKENFQTYTPIQVNLEQLADISIIYKDYAWKYIDGSFESICFQDKQWTLEERLQERIKLHEATDDDFAKYSRQVRCNVDMPHSQQVLDYIDSYNIQVSDTVNQPNYPQEVTYPEYKLP